jgi:hypothetical protein
MAIGSIPSELQRGGSDGELVMHHGISQHRRMGALLAAALMLGVAGGALAQNAQERRVPLDAHAIQQKAGYIGNLTTKSISAHTIEQSGGNAGHADLERARALVEAARADLKAGDLAKADAELNEALALVNTQTRSLSASRVANERLEEAYQKRLKAVRTFLAAYRRVAAEKGGGSSAAKEGDALSSMVDDAEGLAKKGDLAQAKSRLDEAYVLTTKHLREMRKGDTLVRSLNFATPKDEYDYEIDRNDSHQMLLKIATGDNPPSPQQLQEIETLRKKAEELRRTAERQGAGGDYKAGIRSLEDSTAELLKAVRTSGLFIP